MRDDMAGRPRSSADARRSASRIHSRRNLRLRRPGYPNKLIISGDTAHWLSRGVFTGGTVLSRLCPATVPLAVPPQSPPPQITLDLDATDDPLHGHQEERFFHGY